MLSDVQNQKFHTLCRVNQIKVKVEKNHLYRKETSSVETSNIQESWQGTKSYAMILKARDFFLSLYYAPKYFFKLFYTIIKPRSFFIYFLKDKTLAGHFCDQQTHNTNHNMYNNACSIWKEQY